MSTHSIPSPRRLRRFVPQQGRWLTLKNIVGEWHPTGAAAGTGLFAVKWSTARYDWWAPLHDFAPDCQRHLIEQCRQQDHDAGYPGTWTEGRR